MTENYLNILAETIRTNWDQPALTDFYLTEDGSAQDTSRGNHYTYGEMYAEICRIADLLTALGLQKGDHIAICGANSAHWVIAYLAIAKMQGVSVTVMHSLMPDEIARLVAFSDAKALFTDGDIWGEISPLCERGVGGEVSDLSPLSAGEGLGVRCVLSLADWSILHSICDQSRRSTDGQPTVNYDVIATHSKENLLDELVNGSLTNGICLDDLAMICFTSGTTGNPKGVMLSNSNISSNIAFLLPKFMECPMVNTLSLLPMAHAGVFVSDIIHLLCRGTYIHILSSRAISQIFASYAIIRPQEVVMVPQMLEKLVDSVGVDTSADILHEKIINIFGGSLEMFCIGGAVLSSKLSLTLTKAHLKYAIGYGTTECGPFISLAMPSYIRMNSVGRICESLQCRISPAGEILVKGENVMLGYYKDPEATAAKIDKDGWLHTGDKGHLDEDGYLYVEGRLEQDIIVLPNGENIRPDNIESLINALPEVSESIVLARDGKLVAIAVLSSPSLQGRDRVRLSILRAVNPQLPLFSQLYDVEITDVPLQRTEKKTIKRYLYS